jgi:hypothetical protein
MTEPGGSSYPEPPEWVDEPDPDTAQAIDEALDDLDAGRSVVCMSDAAFDALLSELGRNLQPRASWRSCRYRPQTPRPGMYELRWAQDGRALWRYGREVRPGHHHII